MSGREGVGAEHDLNGGITGSRKDSAKDVVSTLGEVVEVMKGSKLYNKVLFGCPSEIVKVFMKKGLEMPNTFVLPDEFYKNGVIQAALEFPLYHFLFVQGGFFKGEKLKIVGTESQIVRIRNILEQTLTGPTETQYKEWGVDQSYIDTWLPMQTHFALKNKDGTIATLDDMISFYSFDNNFVQLPDILIQKKRDNKFTIHKGNFSAENSDIIEVDINFEGKQDYDVEMDSNGIIPPCILGMTSLTNCTSGFDSNGGTTAMVLWLNALPVAIDGTANMKGHLNKSGIGCEAIKGNMLTHNHEDHSQIVDLILNGHKVHLLTTRAIYESFMIKVSNYLGCSIERAKEFVDFFEVKPGEKVTWYGAEFEFWDTAHPIPTIGFKVSINGKTLTFSGDTVWGDQLKPLLDKGVISQAHFDRLNTITDGADLVFLDSGGGMIHPDPKDIDKRLLGKNVILTHRSTLDGGLDKKFELTKPGNHYPLIHIEDSNPIYAGILMSAPLFQGVSIEWLTVILSRTRLSVIPQGETIIEQGAPGKNFYVLLQGNIGLSIDGKEIANLYGGDFFGEMSLISDGICSASTVTKSNCVVAEIPRDIFLDMIRYAYVKGDKNSHILDKLEKIYDIRPVLLKFASFSNLNSNVVNDLIESLVIQEYNDGEIIVEEGGESDKLYGVMEGEVGILSKNVLVTKLPELSIFGEIGVFENKPRTASVMAMGKVKVFCISKVQLDRIMKNTPILMYQMGILVSERQIQAKENSILRLGR